MNTPRCFFLSLLLVVAHLLGLLQQLRGVVDSAEGAHGGVDALVHEVAGDDDPEEVHQDKVAPVVGCLGAGVGDVEDVVVEQGRRVIQDVAVELAERDNELERVAERVVDGDQVGGDEGEGSPEGLRALVVRGRRVELTYSRDGLHAQDKGVLGQVARVAEGVLLPQLAKQILHAAHALEVVGKVALEEQVDAAARGRTTS